MPGNQVDLNDPAVQAMIDRKVDQKFAQVQQASLTDELTKIDRQIRGTVIVAVITGVLSLTAGLGAAAIARDATIEAAQVPTIEVIDCVKAQERVRNTTMTTFGVKKYSELTDGQLIILDTDNSFATDSQCRSEREIAQAILPP